MHTEAPLSGRLPPGLSEPGAACDTHPLRPQTLLGGRVIHVQDEGGNRTGIEPVLLAAAIAARPGARVIEGGCGAGAALMCLAWRVPRLHGIGIEADPATAERARGNIAANIAGNAMVGLSIVTARLPELPVPEADGPFDHAFANPPWHEADATASPEARRDLARRAPRGLLAQWTAAFAQRLRHRGSLTYILPAARHAEALAALHGAGFGALATLPLWPKAGRAARLVLVSGRKGAASPALVLPGLVLHEANGCYTAQAQAIFSEGAALPMDEITRG